MISIITINYNNAAGLEQTILSVIAQTYGDFEHIIIDGDSTDDSKKVIEKYNENLHFWVSEKDAGIYNAMNKGINRATRDYCLFLNSGDILANKDVIKNIAYEIITNPGYDIYFGDLKFYNTETEEYKVQLYPETVSLNYLSTSSLGHPGAFISKNLLLRTNGYSEKYVIISDWIFFVQAFLMGAKFRKVHLICAIFDQCGISSNHDLVNNERKLAFENEFSNLKTDFKLFKTLRMYEGSKSQNMLNSILINLGFRDRH